METILDRNKGPSTSQIGYKNNQTKNQCISESNKVFQKPMPEVSIDEIRRNKQENYPKNISFEKFLFNKRAFNKDDWKGLHDDKLHKHICQWI